MNKYLILLKGLYYNSHLELKAKGKEVAAKQTGTVLITVALVFNFVTIVMLLAQIFPPVSGFIDSLFRSIFGRQFGKIVGKITALLLMCIFFVIIKLTWDKPENYQKMIAEFETKTEQEQQQLSKNGLTYFFVSIGAFAFSFLLFFIL